jgi:hypothetical protein
MDNIPGCYIRGVVRLFRRFGNVVLNGVITLQTIKLSDVIISVIIAISITSLRIHLLYLSYRQPISLIAVIRIPVSHYAQGDGSHQAEKLTEL